MGRTTTGTRPLRLVASGLAVCLCGMAAMGLWAAYGDELLDATARTETDAVVVTMQSEEVPSGNRFQGPKFRWRVHYTTRDEMGSPQEGTLRVPTASTVRPGQTVRVWETTGGRAGLVGDGFSCAPGHSFAFFAACLGAVVAALIFGLQLCLWLVRLFSETPDPVAGRSGSAIDART